MPMRRSRNITIFNNKAVEFLFGASNSNAIWSSVETIASNYGTDAGKAIEEFRRFIALKIFTRDENAMVISPTVLMDEVWHAAILNTSFYRDLQATVRLRIDHRPSGASDQGFLNRLARSNAMRALYASFFRELPFESVSKDTRPQRPSQIEISQVPAAIKAIEVGPNTRVERLKMLCQQYAGLPAQIQLTFAGKELEDGKNLSQYNIQQRSSLRMMLRLSRSIRVSIRNVAGKTIILEVESLFTVEEAMYRIYSEEGIPADLQHLYFAGRKLDRDKTLEHYGIDDGVALRLFYGEPQFC